MSAKNYIKYKFRHGSVGFSLVEVTLSIAILAFGLMGIVGLLPIGLDAFNDAQQHTMAQQMADRIAAEIKQSNFNDLQENYARYTEKDEKGDREWNSPLAFFFDARGEPVAWNDPKRVYESKPSGDWDRGLLTKKSPFNLPVGNDPNPDILIIEIPIVYNPGKLRWQDYPPGATIFTGYVFVGNGVNTANIESTSTPTPTP